MCLYVHLCVFLPLFIILHCDYFHIWLKKFSFMVLITHWQIVLWIFQIFIAMGNVREWVSLVTLLSFHHSYLHDLITCAWIFLHVSYQSVIKLVLKICIHDFKKTRNTILLIIVTMLKLAFPWPIHFTIGSLYLLIPLLPPILPTSHHLPLWQSPVFSLFLQIWFCWLIFFFRFYV